MSHTSNDQLMSEAVFYADYFEGTLHAELLSAAMAAQDMELLAERVNEARREAFFLEFNPNEVEAADVA